ncbi:MAG: hypothetical protein PVH63_05750 [Balneolaceae bacterium]|jgi:carotenoid 1,2-hydratase
MNIFSDASKDVRNALPKPGGYEWWYFDAISKDGTYSFVVIFYEGNPFSTRYIKALQTENGRAMADEYPAVSISVYERGKPIFYSFTEFDPPDCSFSENQINVQVGRHALTGEMDDKLRYTLILKEDLPSGDRLDAEISFESPVCERPLFKNVNAINTGHRNTGHRWNLVQPRADVKGKIRLASNGKISKKIDFEGRGYHDHNTGNEPMRDEFRDWYWGRFHFETMTLVYYVMNRRRQEQHKAWLIDKQNCQVLDILEDIALRDHGLSLFGLKTARQIILRSPNAKIRIQQLLLLDNGPFYQRYQSKAFLGLPGKNIIESQSGITEYIYPSRIYTRIFWPFVNMRIRYAGEGPHWVQRSKTLYRWTW